MSKLIYENDAGQQISCTLSLELILDLEALHGIDVWDEIWKAFKAEMLNEIQLAKEAAKNGN